VCTCTSRQNPRMISLHCCSCFSRVSSLTCLLSTWLAPTQSPHHHHHPSPSTYVYSGGKLWNEGNEYEAAAAATLLDMFLPTKITQCDPYLTPNSFFRTGCLDGLAHSADVW